MVVCEELEELKERLEALELEKEELENQEENDAYDEYLDDTKEEWIKNYHGGMAFKNIDPFAYRCGLVDFNNSRLCDLEEEIEEVKEEIEVLKNG